VVIDGSAKTAFCETEKIRAAGLDIPQVTALLQTVREQGLLVDTDVFQFDEAVETIFQAAKGGKSC
jgi:energy-coupling factor transport system ATP-binding protein